MSAGDHQQRSSQQRKRVTARNGQQRNPDRSFTLALQSQ
jgi:hypothetical protein